MFVAYRGGVPHVFNKILDNGNIYKHTVNNSSGTIYLWVKVIDYPGYLYFNVLDAIAGTNGIYLDPLVNSGIYQAPCDVKDIWIKGDINPTVFEIVACKGRG